MPKQTSSLQIRQLERTILELNLAYDYTIEAWTRALDYRDKEPEGHTRRVTEMTVRFAKRVGVKETDIPHIQRGALLHDIGKLCIPDSILLKTSALSRSDWMLIRRHPQFAYDLLSSIAFLFPALDIPHYHHEKWDGTGYPEGLKGRANSTGGADLRRGGCVHCVDIHAAIPESLVDRNSADIYTPAGWNHFDPRLVGLFIKPPRTRSLVP